MPSPSKAKKPAPVRDERQTLRQARRVLALEAAAIAAMSERLDDRISRAVDLIAECRGKTVVTGMGKSGLIGRKIAATLASTGTPATFLHAAEAVHGDFGAVGRADVVIALSHSGETEEIIRLVPLIKRFELPLIAMTGAPESTLAKAADVALDTSVAEEACPLGLAPTTSTTVALALGDALAVVLLERRGFTEQDFAELHPAGSLGRRLLKVAEVMHVGDSLPQVTPDATFADTVLEISSKRLGVTGVVDGKGALLGVVTDGDLRRALQRKGDLQSLCAADVMTRQPKTIDPTALAARALAEMERYSITSLFVVEPESGRPVGVVHLHDLLKAGVA
jgi:arabinose-5-phosphate isomerase